MQRTEAALREAQAAGALVLGPGERMDVIGQYPLLLSAELRLWWIVPTVLLSMLALLYWQFRSLSEALIVLASVPFALVGSIWTLHWLGYPLSAPVWVGLLSVVGLAMQTAVVMVVYIDEAFHRRVAEGRLRTREDVIEAHAEGTVRRLRPKLMTVATLAAGLLPLLWAEGPGSEILRRVAAPMVGGLLTSAFLTLEVLPVLYTLWRVHQLRAAERRGLDPSRAFYRRTGADTEGTRWCPPGRHVVARGGQRGVGRPGHGQRVSRGGEAEGDVALRHVDGVGHRGEAEERHAGDPRCVGGLDGEGLPVADVGRGGGDDRPRSLEEVGRGEELRVVLVGGHEVVVEPAAGHQHPRVGGSSAEEVEAPHVQRGQGGQVSLVAFRGPPRIPAPPRWGGGGTAAGGQHVAVGQHGECGRRLKAIDCTWRQVGEPWLVSST